MIALDTNVVVRVLIDDDPSQAAFVRRLIERALEDGATLFVPAIVVCETVWVLERSYGFSRSTVAEAVTWLLSAEQLTVENSDDAERALLAFAEGKGDFADFLLRERALAHGAQAVATFDRALLGSPGFVAPDPATWDDSVSLHEATPPYRTRRRRVPGLRSKTGE